MLEIVEWKIHLCDGTERFHLSGVRPLDYHILRGLRTLRETSDELVATYLPERGDTLPDDWEDVPEFRGTSVAAQ